MCTESYILFHSTTVVTEYIAAYKYIYETWQTLLSVAAYKSALKSLAMNTLILVNKISIP